jgi:hypothetical protein
MLTLPLTRWRRLMLRLRLVLLRALLATVEAVVTTPIRGPRSRPGQITQEQTECTHRYRTRRGNAHGSGEYCTACGLRLEWTPSARSTPLAVTRTTRRSLQESRAPAAAPARTMPATPARRAPERSPATMAQAPAPRSTAFYTEDIPEEPQLRTPPLDVNQYPSWEESEAGQVDLVVGRVLCECGLPMIRARVVANPSQVSTYCWKCPRMIGEQCRTSLYETNVEAYVSESPHDRYAVIDPFSYQPDTMSQGDDF